MRFKSTSRIVGALPAYGQTVVKNEPMFFSASLEFALRHGGAITDAFVRALPAEFRSDPTAYLDSRVHMLMPGWYPCIPGWHHDDVPRNTADGQPNYVDPPYRARHVMVLVNGDIAPTEFLDGDVYVPTPLKGPAIYKQWDEAIEDQLAHIGVNLSYRRFAVSDRTLYEFDCDTFHRGTAAVANGWRWFGRVSIGRERRVPSEIRRQAQVYMPTINAGW